MFYNSLTRLRNPTAYRLKSLYAMSSAVNNAAVLVEETPNKAVLILNRPKVLNAVNTELLRLTHEYLKKFEKTKILVIIKGIGDRSFTVGGDLGALIESNLLDSKNFFKEVYTMKHFIRNYSIPYVAFMDGITMGGGVGLSVHGKYQVATERTVLAMPETAIGLFPDVGSSYFLSRLDGKIGLYIGMSGTRLIGEDVMKAGLATHFCESSRLNEVESALLNCNDPSDVPNILNNLTSKRSKEVIAHFSQINKCFSGTTVEEIFKNLETDGSEWALNTLKTLKKMSPLSLKITHRQLQEGAHLSLAEGLKMEFRLASRCLEHSNFTEGIRALIIDKDKKPKWNPSTIEDVTEDDVAKFFAKLPDDEELKL